MPLDLREEVLEGLTKFGLQPTTKQANQTVNYLSLLEKWNKSYNLVSTKNVSELVERHLLDSLTINPFLSGRNILDIGSGAGFPGIPLAIFNPDKNFTLVDSNGKKTQFLFQVKITLELCFVEIENCRIEHYHTARQIDMVVCRALSNLADVVTKIRHVVSKGCRIFVMKGKVPNAEIRALPDDFVVVNAIKVNLPGVDIERHLIEICRK